MSANAIETLRQALVPGYPLKDVPAALAAVETLLEAAENAVYATLAVLPLEGSGNTGYRAKPTTQTTTVALPEEWNDAAEAIAALDAARRRMESGQ